MSSCHSAASLLRTAAAGSKSNLEGGSSSASPPSSSSSSSIVAANNSSTGPNPTNGNVRSPSDGDGRPFPAKSNNGGGEQRTSAASLLLAASSTFARASGLTNEADGDEDDDGFEEDSKFAAADGYNTNGGYNADADGDSYNTNGGSSYNIESSTTVLVKAASAKDGSGGSVLAVKSECCRRLLRGIESLEVAAAAADADADGRNDIIRADGLSDEDQRARRREEARDYHASRKAATGKPLDGPPFSQEEIAYFREAYFYGHAWTLECYDTYLSDEDEPMIQKLVEDDEARRGAPLSDDDFFIVVFLHLARAYHARREAATSESLDGPPTTLKKIAYFREACYYKHPWTMEYYDTYLVIDPGVQKHCEARLYGRNDVDDEDIVADYNTESSTNGGSVLAAASGRGNRLLSSGSNFSSPSGSGSGLGIGSLNVADADDDGRDDISKSLEELLSVARNGGLHGLPEEQQRKLLEFVVNRIAATSDALDGLPTTPVEIVYFMEASMYEHSWALEMYEKYLADNPVIQKHLEEYEARRGVSLVPTHKKAVHASLCLAKNKGAEAAEAINEFNGEYSRQLSDIIINISGASPSTAARVIQSPAASNGRLTRATDAISPRSASASASSSVGHEALFVLDSLQMADLLLILESKLSAEDIADAMEKWKNTNSIGDNPIFRHCETPSDVFHEFDVYHFGTTIGGDTNDNASVADGSASRYVSEEEEGEEAGVPREIAVQAGL